MPVSITSGIGLISHKNHTLLGWREVQVFTLSRHPDGSVGQRLVSKSLVGKRLATKVLRPVPG